jgi:hypothetical protein
MIRTAIVAASLALLTSASFAHGGSQPSSVSFSTSHQSSNGYSSYGYSRYGYGRRY